MSESKRTPKERATDFVGALRRIREARSSPVIQRNLLRAPSVKHAAGSPKATARKSPRDSIDAFVACSPAMKRGT